jgi:hypothetical protein
MCPCTVKSDEAKSTYAGLAQEIGYSPACLLSLQRLVKRAAVVHLLEKSVINRI